MNLIKIKITKEKTKEVVGSQNLVYGKDFYKYHNIKEFAKRNNLVEFKNILELFYNDTEEIKIKLNKEDHEKE